MWYFSWILGVSFAVLLAILNAMWLEAEEDSNKLAESKSNDPETS